MKTSARIREVLDSSQRQRLARTLERSLVRHAIRLAQLGQKTLLVDTGSRFRVVLSDEAAAALRPELKILAQLAGGTLVVARQRR